MTAPKIVFVIPYRNRPTHRHFFLHYMQQVVLLGRKDYEMVFVHQMDDRPFNRGAMKNIGFLSVKQRYPQEYKQITFVFNDVDTIPYTNILNYETTAGVVKHFYGFEYALGGIVAMRGSDFEAANGFPNLWGWGKEDRSLQIRCERLRLRIDRGQFYAIGAPEILHLFDGVSRIVNDREVRDEPQTMDGIRSIAGLNVETSALIGGHILEARVTQFTVINPPEGQYYEYDLRAPLQKLREKPTNKIETDPRLIPKLPNNRLMKFQQLP